MKRATILCMSILLVVPVWSALAQEPAAPGLFTEVETAVCASVTDRQPEGIAETFSPDVGQVFLWTKFVGAADSTMVQHVWLYNGNEMATVDLPVKSSMWRTWSSKKILPAWVGDWEVKVMDAEGNILKSVTFKIEQPAAPVETPPETEPEVEPEVEPQADST